MADGTLAMHRRERVVTPMKKVVYLASALLLVPLSRLSSVTLESVSKSLTACSAETAIGLESGKKQSLLRRARTVRGEQIGN